MIEPETRVRLRTSTSAPPITKKDVFRIRQWVGGAGTLISMKAAQRKVVGSWSVLPDHPARIAAVAARLGTSMSAVVRDAIERALRRHERAHVAAFIADEKRQTG